MSNLHQIFYCNVGEVCWDTYGNIYPIKTGGNWKHVNVNNTKIGVSKLPIKMKVFDFDDVVFAYIFGGLHSSHPCPAIGYYVYKKVSKKTLTMIEYFKQNKA
jgi:hypothetical protein